MNHMREVDAAMLEVMDPTTGKTIHIDGASIEPSVHQPGDLPHEAYWTANSVMNAKTGGAEEYPKRKVRTRCSSSTRRNSPPGRKATYLKIVASYRPQKDNPYRIRFTVGGDKLTNYAGPCSAPTAEI